MSKKHPQLALIGYRIREIRLAKGISQEQLAAISGISRSYFGGLERGERNIAALNIIRVAIALDVEVGDLFPPTEIFEKA
jgi:transcriptional regulator with XRE-family HTH domain